MSQNKFSDQDLIRVTTWGLDLPKNQRPWSYIWHWRVPTLLNRIHVLLVVTNLKKDNPEHKRHEIKIEKDIVQVSCWNSSIAQWDQLLSYRMRGEKNSSVKDSSRRCEYFMIKTTKAHREGTYKYFYQNHLQKILYCVRGVHAQAPP